MDDEGFNPTTLQTLGGAGIMGKAARRIPIAGIVVILAFALTATAHDGRTGTWFDEVIVLREPSAERALSLIEIGAIALYSAGITDSQFMATVERNDALALGRHYGTSVELTFNTAGPVFEDGTLNPFALARVREAMNWLVDREHLVQAVYGGNAIPRYVPLSTVSLDYARYIDVVRRLERAYASDPAKAERIVAEAMTSLGATRVQGIWHYGDRPVVITVLIRSDDERVHIGNYFADLLEQIGFATERRHVSHAEAAEILLNTLPHQGRFHVYTGGWSARFIIRDQGDAFRRFYTGRILPWPLHLAFTPDSDFDRVIERLAHNDFTSLEERRQLFTEGLEAALVDSARVWLVDRVSATPRRASVQVAADLAGGVSGTPLWAHTLRKEGQVGGRIALAAPDVLSKPWNPLGGSDGIIDQMLIQSTGDRDVVPDPYTGLPLPQRILRAELFVENKLPVTQHDDWIDLHFRFHIPVPADTWVDWDAAQQRFITAEEKYPDGLSAKTKSVVYYPSDVFELRWHDGSPLSVGDFVLRMILAFDRGKVESPYYDPAAAGDLDRFARTFRGVRIVSTDPLVIETYSDAYPLDAEAAVFGWFPTYDGGPGPWHTLALGLFADAQNEAAFGATKAADLGIDHLNYITGPTLTALEQQLEKAASNSLLPYEKTLRQYVGALEIAQRWHNLKVWYKEKGHFWVGTGPLYLERAYPEEGIVHLRRNEAYPDPVTRWELFEAPTFADVTISGPRRIRRGSDADFDIAVTAGDVPYPPEQIEIAKFLLYDATGALVHTGVAEPVFDGAWRVRLDSTVSHRLRAGISTLEVVIVPQNVSLPSFDSIQFITTP